MDLGERVALLRLEQFLQIEVEEIVKEKPVGVGLSCPRRNSCRKDSQGEKQRDKRRCLHAPASSSITLTRTLACSLGLIASQILRTSLRLATMHPSDQAALVPSWMKISFELFVP